MSYIWPARESIAVHDASELAHAPRTIVSMGVAPDGLPWLLDVDRAERLDLLFRTVLQVFELDHRDSLPERVRQALENDVAAGLMGVHELPAQALGPGVIDGGGKCAVYVSRRKAKRLLGPTLLAQMLEGSRRSAEAPSFTGAAATNVAAMAAREQDEALVEAVERSIRDRQAKRHLLIDLATGHVYTGSVRTEDRALRAPSPPYRYLVAESLLSLPGTQAVVTASHSPPWRVPVADQPAYLAVLTRAHQSHDGGHVQFEVPRQQLLRALVAVARDVARLHERGLVHSDLAPGNILLADGGPLSFDSLDLTAGTPATAATFAWAAPEQIIGHPVDPRTDVFSLGRIATALVQGVPFGEETTYVVPTGGGASRRVELLKTEGVFVDILDRDHDRAWQLAWQTFLGDSSHYQPERRPRDGAAFADRLAELVEHHPVTGEITCAGDFGTPHVLERSGQRTFARVVAD